MGQKIILCRVFLQQQLLAQFKDVAFHELYGWSCRTLLQWDQPRERQVFGLDILSEAKENIKVVRENLKIAQSRQ
jgi:hypothetical protein